MHRLIMAVLMTVALPEFKDGKVTFKSSDAEPRYEVEVDCRNGATPRLERRGPATWLVCDAR